MLCGGKWTNTTTFLRYVKVAEICCQIVTILPIGNKKTGRERPGFNRVFLES